MADNNNKVIINDIITEIYNEKIIDEIINNMGVKENDKDDLIEEIFLILLEYNFEKIIEMYEKKQLKWFIIRIIQNQYFSKNSTFYAKYKKYYKFIDENSNLKNNNDNIEDND